MRKSSIYLALLLAASTAALTVVSCTPDSPTSTQLSSTTPDAQRVEQLKEEFGWMGDYHTQALTYVAAKLQEKKNASLGQAERCKLGIASLKQFHKAYRKDGRPLEFNDLSTIDGFCDAASELTRVASLEMAPPTARRSDLSQAAASDMTQIEQAFDEDLSRAALESRIYGIQNAAAANLSSDEAGAVVGLGSIALSSIDYWDANADSWSSIGPAKAYSRGVPAGANFGVVTKAPLLRYGVSPRGRAIMKADVSAALVTLMYEWWMGAFCLQKAAVRGAAASLVAGILHT